ncbi:MAG: hypothetical protein NZ992_05205 [Candidatus Korarchaeum sp.]|nr:hypothetical protein [Candidatus Korarchaeum sp.]MDW8035168.1 hypothetical protein [Candidatus Korarchaeum sp.]
MKKLSVVIISLLLLLPYAINLKAAPTPLPIIVSEYVNATISTEGFGYLCGPWNVSGRIVVLNNKSGETVSDIWIPIYKPAGLTISVLSTPSYANVIRGSPPSYVQADNPSAPPGSELEFWHVTQLRNGDNVTLGYTYVGTGCPGLRVEERYDPVKIVNGVSSIVNVKLNITNNFGFNLDVKVKKVLPADNGDEGWQNASNNPIFSGTPNANVGSVSYSASGKEFYWTRDGSWPDGWFTLAAGASGNSTFQIKGTPDLSEVGGYTQKITLGVVYIYLRAERTFTGLAIGKVFAISDAAIDVKKEQSVTSPNTWMETLVFYDTSAVFRYDLFNTTVWATRGETPDSNLIAGSRNTQQFFNITQLEPGGSYTYGPFSFTYNGIPKVWGLAKFRITNDDDEGWWSYYNLTVAGPDPHKSRYQVHEEIWAVRGYLVKAKKEVVSESTAGCYVIGISLQNIGEWAAPYVEFYDVVPLGFNPNPSGTEGGMVFRPLSMLALDADPNSPPDYSLITSPSGYTKGYVWKAYPIPAPQSGFTVYFERPGVWKTVELVYRDGHREQLNVMYDGGMRCVQIGEGDCYIEGENFLSYEDWFYVHYIDPNLTTGGGGWVVITASGSYENLNMGIYNPVFVKYRVCGTGVYNATNLFIVGVDPRNTLDAIAVRFPNSSLSFGTSTLEPLMAAVSLILVGAIVLVRKRKHG